jgi:flagellar motility protein MotE (MotC chaperone)
MNNPFVRTMVYGLAGLCILMLAAGVTALVRLKHAGVITPERIRDYLITPEERSYIAQMKERPPEPPVVHESPGLDQDKLLADLAEIAGARHANALVEELRRRKDSLDERERWIEAREAEIRAARTDLARMARQLDAKREEVGGIERKAEEERARFAQLQADEVSRTRVAQESERARYAELAKLYELQKNDAWLTLRKLEPREVARILDRMDLKKAANLLKLAQQDAEYPMAVALHRELMQMNPQASTAEQTRRLAQLYSFMKADQILPYLKGSDPQQIADLLTAMAENGTSDKDRSALLAALARDDEQRAKQVADLLQPTTVQP